MKEFICITHGVVYFKDNNTINISARNFKQCYLLTAKHDEIKTGKHGNCDIKKVGVK